MYIFLTVYRFRLAITAVRCTYDVSELTVKCDLNSDNEHFLSPPSKEGAFQMFDN